MRSARRRGSVLVAGLDPYPGRLPPEIFSRVSDGFPESAAVREFCLGALEAVEPEAAAVKLQAAFFERLGPEGMEVYRDLIAAAGDLDLPVISDVKRGDIGPVAAAYAEAHLAVYGAACVTVNPYMGADAVEPFLRETRRLGRGGGVFSLVATSNPSAGELQGAGSPPLFELAARLVAGLGEVRGDYSDAGAVVGATRPEIGARVRELMPDALFLVPGFGAQGGSARAIQGMLDRRGGGVLVNSSRGVLYAYEAGHSGGADGPASDYRSLARRAAAEAREALREAGARP
ncbi:orotidine-5'-phosphate decarboxylase [Rubrobacter aplysinae]|uniref:orotidine-5'-phosphate decarboxylase n=1 Tax=Rubrobacter aplysinae TaxID=909625 RepID=UPI00064BA80A|nr:orotidine-5'-phosphate decarboxylase [Rubrobacter aplysinae]